jgi:hypothetical protein
MRRPDHIDPEQCSRSLTGGYAGGPGQGARKARGGSGNRVPSVYPMAPRPVRDGPGPEDPLSMQCADQRCLSRSVGVDEPGDCWRSAPVYQLFWQRVQVMRCSPLAAVVWSQFASCGHWIAWIRQPLRRIPAASMAALAALPN